MTESSDVKTTLENKINQINKFAITLKGSDLKKLSGKLQELRNYTGSFEYWIDEQIRAQIEAEAEKKVKTMVAAGFSFNSIIVDKVKFFITDTGEIKKYDPCQDDDGIPF